MTVTSSVPEKSGNGLGVAALVLGIVAVLIALIPIVGVFLVWVPALVGVGLGIAAVVKKNVKKVIAWVGLGLSAVSIFVAIATAAAGIGAASNAVSKVVSDAMTDAANQVSASAAASQPKEIVYSVTGDGGASLISYSTWSNGSWGSSSSNAASLPWSTTIDAEASTSWLSFKGFSVSAVGTASTTSIGCTITVDGKVVSTQTGTGPYATVSCIQASY